MPAHHRTLPSFNRLCLALAVVLLSHPCFGQGTVVLVIDDMGNGLELGQRALRLPGKVNYAFLPHTPNGRELAEQAHRLGQEVMLHLPMSNLSNQATGPGKLSPIMNREQFTAVLEDNLQSIPHVRGVNNHMGSLLTQLYQPMQWLMQSLKQHQLYFIDSRTSPRTVAEKTAQAERLPTLRRDVFLDNDLKPQQIEKRVQHWLRLAHRNGVAVAIAHPHPQTLSVLEKVLPGLRQRGIRMALASEVLQERMAHSSAPQGTLPKL